MGRLSRWAVRSPWWAIGGWVVLVAAVFVLGGRFGGNLNDSFSLPDTESLKAQNLLEQMPKDGGASEATTTTATVVWSPTSGSAVDGPTGTKILPLLTAVSKLPGVACVTNPYSRTGEGLGAKCQAPPAPQVPTDLTAEQKAQFQAAGLAAQKATSPISADGSVAKAVVSFTGASDGSDVPTETANEIVAKIKAANSADLQVGGSGQILDFAGQEPPSSEGVGVTVALIILLIAFGSLLTAFLPLLTAIFGVSLGGSLLLFTARFVDVATFAPILATMIGLGVGIDYSLFVINRYRQAVLAGKDPKAAAYESVNTSGRAVVFAASTVVIALLGLFVMRINFFNGLALAASGTVLLVMLSAIWLLPALLSLLGARAIAPVSKLVHFGPLYRLTRHARRTEIPHEESGRWAQYARFLQRRPIVPVVLVLVVVGLLAAPALQLRLGFPDDSGKPQGSIGRTAYDLTAKGFGAGTNGPFFVAVQLPKNGDIASLTAAVSGLEATEGVAKVLPSTAMLPIVAPGLANQSITAIQVVPTTGPQDVATGDLLVRLREQTIPGIAAKTGVVAYIGGQTAIIADFSDVLAKAMPLFLGIVILLGFLSLMVLFRSAVVSATAVVTSLLSFLGSLGITVAVFQNGVLNGPLGISGTGPIFPFLPVMVFAILFGLSMDYHVFLVSRMQEEWTHTKENRLAVRRGLGGSGRVVLMAALIMASVFAAFIPTPNSIIKLFGISLTSAVLIDAFLIRLIFIPSFMTLLGSRNWWLPSGLAKRLPEVHIEEEGDADLAAERELAPSDDDTTLEPSCS